MPRQNRNFISSSSKMRPATRSSTNRKANQASANIAVLLIEPLMLSFRFCITKMLKVSWFQYDFMKSSFLPKYEQKIVRVFTLTLQGRNPDNFSFVFWEKLWLHKFILNLSDRTPKWLGSLLTICMRPRSKTYEFFLCRVGQKSILRANKNITFPT